MLNIQKKIAYDFGFSDLSDRQQLELIDKMTESVIKRVLVKAYCELSEEKRLIFESLLQLIETKTNEHNTGSFLLLENFLRENISDLSGMIQQAVEELKKHMNDDLSEQSRHRKRGDA